MPSNQKTFFHVNEQDYARFRGELRVKGWVPPSGNSGLLQGGGAKNGLLLGDLHFDEKEETISLRLRNVPHDETYDSVFGQFWKSLSMCSDRASENP